MDMFRFDRLLLISKFNLFSLKYAVTFKATVATFEEKTGDVDLKTF